MRLYTIHYQKSEAYVCVESDGHRSICCLHAFALKKKLKKIQATTASYVGPIALTMLSHAIAYTPAALTLINTLHPSFIPFSSASGLGPRAHYFGPGEGDRLGQTFCMFTEDKRVNRK